MEIDWLENVRLLPQQQLIQESFYSNYNIETISHRVKRVKEKTSTAITIRLLRCSGNRGSIKQIGFYDDVVVINFFQLGILLFRETAGAAQTTNLERASSGQADVVEGGGGTSDRLQIRRQVTFFICSTTR